MNNIRILTIAELLKNTNTVIDVGCDHAYLCIELLKKGYANFVYNVDINKKPLEQGLLNAQRLLKNNNYMFILNNGLEDLNIDADAVAISGMGAKNIISIIENSIIKPKFYVVQPNNNAYLIRQFVKEKNGHILDETIVYEDEHYYEIMKFNLNNESSNILTDEQTYLGIMLKQDDLTLSYFNKRLSYLEEIYNENLADNLKYEFKIINEYLKNK